MHLFPVPGLSGRDVVSYVVCVFPVGSLLARVHIELFPIVFAFSLSRWYFFQKNTQVEIRNLCNVDPWCHPLDGSKKFVQYMLIPNAYWKY